MTPLLKSQAIQTALTGDWNNAINLNQQILEVEPDDIDTLNRLAFAYLSLGQPKKSKNLYEKVLSLDMKNPIAIRNLKRLNDTKTNKINVQLNNLFIEEPGKTRVIELLNIADKKAISHLRSGEMLELKIKRNKIFAIDSEDQYVGMLPDDICQRLIKFINAGNQYDAYVRTVDSNKLCILVREIKRMKRFKDQPSFVSTEKTKLSFKNHKVANQEDTEEEESL
jgi:tetratricopeptide (TPR) repeat protein